ncbi:MAG: hypothetical protein EXX96DRAFT_548496 [Benjaminiella poitrasii]|nr:MAG: hypothetical protein EXX96DRAFT_548496 [Benjaminiella poitrasii]
MNVIEEVIDVPFVTKEDYHQSFNNRIVVTHVDNRPIPDYSRGHQSTCKSFNNDDDIIITSCLSNTTKPIWKKRNKTRMLETKTEDICLITPNHWIHHNEQQKSPTTITRKRSLLSNTVVSYNASDEETTTSDEEDEPPTPTSKEESSVINNSKKEEINEQKTTSLPSIHYLFEEPSSPIPSSTQHTTTPLPRRQSKDSNESINAIESDIEFQSEKNATAETAVTTNSSTITVSNSSDNIMQIPSKDQTQQEKRKKKNHKSWIGGIWQEFKSSLSLFTTLDSKENKSTKKKISLPRISISGNSSHHHRSNNNNKRAITTPTLSRQRPSLPSQQQPSLDYSNSNNKHILYQMSRFKLGDPRRPLCQQVVISNMMYYLTPVANIRPFYPNSIYQATYPSFEPPAPGGVSNEYHHQPYYHHVTTSTDHLLSPSPPPPLFTQLDQDYTAFIVEKGKRQESIAHKKKKYKPVRNTNYNPLLLQNNRMQSL